MDNLYKIITILFILSLISERIANFFKLKLSDTRRLLPKKSGLRYFFAFGNTRVRKREQGEEKDREFRILKINLFFGGVVALAFHADLFALIRHIDTPNDYLSWSKATVGIKGTCFLTDAGAVLLSVIGCLLSGVFLSFGSKFWHDMLDLIMEIKNYKGALATQTSQGTAGASADLSDAQMDSLMTAAIEENYSLWKSRFPNITGCSIGLKKTDNITLPKKAIIFKVSSKIPDSTLASSATIPDTIFYKGYSLPTDVIVMAPVKSLVDIRQPGDKFQPGRLGTNVSRDNATANGTLGLKVFIPPGNVFLLSCMHVLYPERMKLSEFVRGEINVQSSASDTGTLVTVPSAFYRKNDKTQIKVSGHVRKGMLSDSMDAAIAALDPKDLSVNTFDMQQVTGETTSEDWFQGMIVYSYGCMTERLRGEILDVHALKTDVELGDGSNRFSFTFHQLIEISNACVEGDSGAPVLTGDGKVVGIVASGNGSSTFVIPYIFYKKQPTHKLINDMKKIYLLLLLCLAAGRSRAQNNIFSLSYANLATVSEGNFSASKNIVEVEFPDAATATANKDKLKLTMDPANLANNGAAVIVGATQAANPNDTKLRFDIKQKLAGLHAANIGFFLQGAAALYSKNIKLTEVPDVPPNAQSQSSPPPHYFPVVPVTHLSIPNAQLPATIGEARFDNSNYTNLFDREETTREVVYDFSGEHQNSYYAATLKKNNVVTAQKFRVGQPLTIELNPVPNPLRYTVKILTYYSNYNISTDSTLEKTFLGPWDMLGKNRAFDNDPAAQARKNKILGYLQQVNSQLKSYMDGYAQLDGINPATFQANKKTVFDAINTYLTNAPDSHYPGNMSDYVLNEFDPPDSNYVKPILVTYQKFMNFNVTPVVYNLPPLPNADELNVKIQIVPLANISTARQSDTSNHWDIPLFGGFKVDISPGLFYSNFHQDVYTLSADSSSSGGTVTKFKTITKEKENKGSVGFSTLIHFYSRWGRDVNVALSMGSGLTLDDKPQIRYFVGGSLLLGRINRLAITGGWSFGRITELSARYNGGSKQVSNTETTLDTYKTMKSAPFIALSYNIPLVSRQTKATAK